MDATMKVVVIWCVWLGLVLYWLTPEMNAVKDRINEHNEQIKRIINE
jgi:hypothetical protein